MFLQSKSNMDTIVLIPKTLPGGSLVALPDAQRRKDDFACDGKRNVLGEPVQAFQDVECKPSAQACYVGMFTVLRVLHLCLSDSLHVKRLQASVLQKPCSRSQTPAATVSLYLQL